MPETDSEPTDPTDPTESTERSDGRVDDAAERVAGIASERAREGLEHLQAAARELIAAARAALDVAEDLIDDPETVSSMAGAAGSVGDMVGDLVRSVLSPSRPAGGDRDPSDPADAGTDTHGAGASGVQRIEIL
jgi:hypothetical protein